MCGFDLDHYGQPLAAAGAGGHRIALFDHEPQEGDLFLRPEIWVYSGDSMRETMHSMLDRGRQRRLDQLAADKIELS